ncbi:hypothetical protein BH10BAC5_BH10BAC5_12470 [soil metagenome]
MKKDLNVKSVPENSELSKPVQPEIDKHNLKDLNDLTKAISKIEHSLQQDLLNFADNNRTKITDLFTRLLSLNITTQPIVKSDNSVYKRISSTYNYNIPII